MLTFNNLAKAYGPKVLFENAGLSIVRGDRIGLVGPNGAGKSTLFSLILGEDSPDAGSLSLERGAKLGYLPQESAPPSHQTVLDLATAVSPELVAARALLAQPSDAGETDDPDAHHDAIAVLQEHDLPRLEARAKRILAGLAFRDSDFNRLTHTLSGGWVMRAHLARLLVQEPDLLLLDEPTNHLDLQSLLWLQDHLQAYPGALIVISHDRAFLNALVDSIVELRRSRLTRFRGNYDSYLEQRAAREAQHLAAYKNQQREIARLQTFVDRFRAKNTKATQAQSKLKQIDRMEIIEAPEAEGPVVGFRFPQPARSGLRAVALRQVQFGYGPVPVYTDLDFEAQRGDRTVLVGPNGAGKSTLIKLLAGVLEPQSGTRELGHNVRLGYFSQYRSDRFDTSNTVLEEASALPRALPEETIRTVLGCFLFRGDDVFKRVSVLSGGEKSRLALAKLLLDPPNVLLMDEPTTHLDITSIDALIEALRQFEGTLLFISHDVHFIRSVATSVVHVQNGSLTTFPGDYDYFLHKSGAASPAALFSSSPAEPLAAAPAKVPPSDNGSGPKSRDQKRREAEERQAQAKLRAQARQRVNRLEAEILQLEQRRTQVLAALADPGPRAAELSRELGELSRTIEERTAAWDAAASEVA